MMRGHNGVVPTVPELLAAVDAAFADTGRGLTPWADPHPNRSPRDEEYSRVSDPFKWRIIGARADAWAIALVDAGLAHVERNAAVRWHAAPLTELTRIDLVVPNAAGALPLVLARSRFGDVDDAGVTIGAGDPALCVAWVPDCGCDACDSGSQNELDHLDDQFLGIVTGAFRRLSKGDRTITLMAAGSRSSPGNFRRGEVDEILADPTGWHDTSGTSWLSERT